MQNRKTRHRPCTKVTAGKAVFATGPFLAALLLASCIGSRHFQLLDPAGENVAAPYLELYSEITVATLHFPVAVYSLYATDSVGYYYRAPRKIIQHTGAGSVLHDGGIYVRKSNPRSLRGYVFMAGALTHVGNFSAAEHKFSR